MKSKDLMNRVILVCAILFVASTGFAQITTEEDMAEAVFETIKMSDSVTFSSYCISEENMAKAVSGLVDTTQVVKSVKADLQGINPSDIKQIVIGKFDTFLEAVKNENVAISKATFGSLIMNQITMDIPNLMSKKVKFSMSIDTITYIVRIDLFITDSDMFIYDFSFEKDVIQD